MPKKLLLALLFYSVSASCATQSAVFHLMKQHLFGQFVASSADIPITTLPLHLQGIAWSNDATMPSRAIISGADGTTKIYSVGDFLPNHGVMTAGIIKAIEKNQVLIIQQNQLQRLPLSTY